MLRLRQRGILANLNKNPASRPELAQDLTRIKVCVRPEPRQRPPIRSEPRLRVAGQPAVSSREFRHQGGLSTKTRHLIKGVAEDIADPGLRDALHRLARDPAGRKKA